MSGAHAATKNGHPIPTAGGTGFENGEKVLTTQFDYDAVEAKFVHQQREIGRREVMLDLFQIMRRGFDMIVEDENMALAADSYKFAAGTIWKSEVELAEKYGVTKAAVSKRVKQWQELLNLPPASAMRSNKACATFKEKTIKAWTKRMKRMKQPAPKPSLRQVLNLPAT